MPDESHELGDSLISFVKSQVRGHVVYEGTITSVDKTAFTAECLVGDTTFHDVPLKVLMGAQASVLEIPAVNSNVILTFRDGNIQRPQLLFADDIDDLLITVNNQVKFNAGQLGGMVKVITLTQKINNIENLLNNLISLYNSHTHNVTAVGAPTGPSLAPEANTLTPTQQSQIEDTSIIH